MQKWCSLEPARILALAALLALARPASAEFLGLEPGDVPLAIGVEGTGLFDLGTGPLGSLVLEGVVTTLVVEGTPNEALPQTGISFQLSLPLLNQAVFETSPSIFGGGLFGSGGPNDLVISQGGETLVSATALTPDNVAVLFVNAPVPVSYPPLPALDANLNAAFDAIFTYPVLLTGNLTTTGGRDELLASFGNAFFLFAALANASPDLADLASDDNLFDANFAFDFSAVVFLDAPAPFVPEPTTALMFGGGLLGLLALARRRAAR